MPCSLRPIQRAGSRKTGSRINEDRVSCQDSANIAASTSTTVSRLLTAVDRVPVNACCAPSTSLLSRLIRAPVWVRVKKAMGIRCTCENTAERMS